MIPFQTVYAMEIRREENNRKVMLLFIEMRDMMAVLLQYVFILTIENRYLITIQDFTTSKTRM